MYYIYHIPNVKIGCSTQPKTRVTKQGYSSFEILEEHSCIDRASDREIELQKQYGYKVDTIPYKVSVRNRQPWNDKTRYKVWLDEEARKKTLRHPNFIKASKEWHKKDNYKTCIQNIKGARKPKLLTKEQEEYIVNTLHRRKNQHSPIPKGKHTANELAKMYNVEPYLILKYYRKAKIS